VWRNTRDAEQSGTIWGLAAPWPTGIVIMYRDSRQEIPRLNVGEFAGIGPHCWHGACQESIMGVHVCLVQDCGGSPGVTEVGSYPSPVPRHFSSPHLGLVWHGFPKL
jgi:hypothetical protein